MTYYLFYTEPNHTQNIQKLLNLKFYKKNLATLQNVLVKVHDLFI